MTATRHVFEARGRRPAFRTQLEGIQRARRAWVCVRCGCLYETGKRKLDRPVCDAPRVGCGGKTFKFFPSMGEARRYYALRGREQRGEIRDLSAGGDPCRLPLEAVGPDGERVHLADLIVDFTYTEADTGERVFEDWKGAYRDQAATRLWQHKRRHAEAQHGITIRVVSDR